MIESYLFRLVCLCLAVFFLVHLVLGIAVSLIAPMAVRLAERITARSAARLLLTLRLLPAGLALLVVIGLCAPSYLRLEPEGAERVGVACWAATAMCLSIWGISIARALRALVRSRRYSLAWRNAGREMLLPGENALAWVVETDAPLIALAGILRPRLAIARSVVAALTPAELAAALRHEQAHRVSRDNLKRLLALLAPGILPFADGFGRLEQGWAKFAEWAADDWAAGGNARHSLDLAAALICVARLGNSPQTPALVTSLSADSQDLSARVNRLIAAQSQRRTSGGGALILAGGATLCLASAIAATLTRPAVFHSAYRLLESLIQ